jgi:glycerol kinase
MRETGANALLKVTLHLQLSERGGASVIPTLAFDFVGAPNGHFASTKFGAGTIAGAGRRLKNNEIIAPDVLREIMRTADVATALRTSLRTSLRDLKAKEAANADDQLLWSGADVVRCIVRARERAQ